MSVYIESIMFYEEFHPLPEILCWEDMDAWKSVKSGHETTGCQCKQYWSGGDLRCIVILSLKVKMKKHYEIICRLGI